MLNEVSRGIGVVSFCLFLVGIPCQSSPPSYESKSKIKTVKSIQLSEAQEAELKDFFAYGYDGTTTAFASRGGYKRFRQLYLDYRDNCRYLAAYLNDGKAICKNELVEIPKQELYNKFPATTFHEHEIHLRAQKSALLGYISKEHLTVLEDEFELPQNTVSYVRRF